MDNSHAVDAKERMRQIRDRVRRSSADASPGLVLFPSTNDPENERASDDSDLASKLQSLREHSSIEELEFQSSLPVLGRLVVALRSTWNSISTRWYVRYALDQQIRFNREAVSTLAEAVRLQQELHQVLSDRFAQAVDYLSGEIEASDAVLDRRSSEAEERQERLSVELSETVAHSELEIREQLDSIRSDLRREYAEIREDMQRQAQELVSLRDELQKATQRENELRASCLDLSRQLETALTEIRDRPVALTESPSAPSNNAG